MSLTRRLSLFGLLALTPAVAVVAYLEFELRGSRSAEAEEFATRQTLQATSEIEQVVEGARTLLYAVAAIERVERPDPATCTELVGELSNELPQITLAVLDTAGNVTCRNGVVPEGLNYADAPFFTEALATGDFVFGEITLAYPGTEFYFLPFSLPIRDDSGAIRGVAVAGISLRWLNELIAAWDIPEGAAITIADRNGIILARTPFPEDFVGTPITEPFLSNWVQGARASVERVTSRDGTVRLQAYKPVSVEPAGLYISTGISEAEVFASVNRARTSSLLIIIAGALAAVGAGVLAGRYFVRRPVDELLRVAESWRAGTPQPASPRVGTGEFAEIAAALSGMGEALLQREQAAMQAAEQQKLLRRELDHRVKNTLATVQAIAAQTASATPDPQEFREKFELRLKSLSRTHDMLTRDHWAGVPLETLLASELAPVPDQSRITLDGPELALGPEVAIALSLILHELATNAVKYGALSSAAARLAVRWSVSEDHELDLTWTETGGPPVSPPSREGFGSRLIGRMVRSMGEGGSEYRPEGLVFRLRMTLPERRRPEPFL